MIKSDNYKKALAKKFDKLKNILVRQMEIEEELKLMEFEGRTPSEKLLNELANTQAVAMMVFTEELLQFRNSSFERISKNMKDALRFRLPTGFFDTQREWHDSNESPRKPNGSSEFGDTSVVVLNSVGNPIVYNLKEKKWYNVEYEMWVNKGGFTNPKKWCYYPEYNQGKIE